MKFQSAVKAIFLLACSFTLMLSCSSEPSKSTTNQSLLPGDSTNYTLYKGSISRAGLDSIYNELYLFKDETFRLEQVERLGEHHLNEKTTNGLYSYLKNGDQIGLFLSGGTLILRFAVKKEGLYLMDMEGSAIRDSDRVWKPQNE